MIPRSFRLPKTRIGFLLKKGGKLANDQLMVRYRSGGFQETHSRFAVTVSLKVHPKAVKRNRLRRQIYETIRLNIGLIKDPTDIIIIVKPPILKMTAAQIRRLIITFLKKIG